MKLFYLFYDVHNLMPEIAATSNTMVQAQSLSYTLLDQLFFSTALECKKTVLSNFWIQRLNEFFNYLGVVHIQVEPGTLLVAIKAVAKYGPS